MYAPCNGVITHEWKMRPEGSGCDEEDINKPWWKYFQDREPLPKDPITGLVLTPKCPICLFRVCTVRTLPIGGKNEHCCGECASLHYKTMKMEIDGIVVSKTVYLTTEQILGVKNKRRVIKTVTEEIEETEEKEINNEAAISQ